MKWNALGKVSLTCGSETKRSKWEFHLASYALVTMRAGFVPMKLIFSLLIISMSCHYIYFSWCVTLVSENEFDAGVLTVATTIYTLMSQQSTTWSSHIVSRCVGRDLVVLHYMDKNNDVCATILKESEKILAERTKRVGRWKSSQKRIKRVGRYISKDFLDH
jgi:hypothetical protein